MSDLEEGETSPFLSASNKSMSYESVKSEETASKNGKKSKRIKAGNPYAIVEEAEDCSVDEDEEKDDLGGCRLTYETALILKSSIEMNMRKHNIANVFFEFKAFYFFKLPQSILTAIASVLAFAASSELLKPYDDYITLTVGALSSIVVLLQTIDGVKNFGVRADRHNACAIQLRDLRDDMSIICLKLEQLEHMPKRKRQKYRAEYVTYESIQKSYKQCLSGCASAVPMEVTEAFQSVESNIEIAETFENRSVWNVLYPNSDHKNLIKDKAYDILSGEIIDHWMFPAQLPSSIVVAERTMYKLRFVLRELQTYGKDVVAMVPGEFSNCYGFCPPEKKNLLVNSDTELDGRSID